LSQLKQDLALVGPAKLAVAFCPPGCKMNWSATEASVTERFAVLNRTAYRYSQHSQDAARSNTRGTGFRYDFAV
jgi:hypothetical protein